PRVSRRRRKERVMAIYRMGIDPGSSGGIAVIVNDRLSAHNAEIGDADEVRLLKLKDATERDVFNFIAEFTRLDVCAVIERVSSTPQMGVVSAFTFGKSYGFLRGAL